jgi:hypothetical protein
VLIEQIDDIGLEALERCLGDLLDLLLLFALFQPHPSSGQKFRGQSSS